MAFTRRSNEAAALIQSLVLLYMLCAVDRKSARHVQRIQVTF